MDATCSGELGTAIKELPPSQDLVEVLVDGARYGDMEDVQSALQHGVNVNSADSSGRTALHMAAANGHASIASCLIQAGATVDVVNTEGNTPLHWACLNGCTEVAKVLLDAGANAANLNSHSNTPVDEALGKPYQDEILALISSYHSDTKTQAAESQMQAADSDMQSADSDPDEHS